MTLRPWALGRIEQPSDPMPLRYDRVELDPATQTGRYLDATGRPIEMGKHGTQRPTQKATTTRMDGPGRSDADATPDYQQD